MLKFNFKWRFFTKIDENCFCKHDQESKPVPDLLGKIPDPDAAKNVRIRNRFSIIIPHTHLKCYWKFFPFLQWVEFTMRLNSSDHFFDHGIFWGMLSSFMMCCEWCHQRTDVPVYCCVVRHDGGSLSSVAPRGQVDINQEKIWQLSFTNFSNIISKSCLCF